MRSTFSDLSPLLIGAALAAAVAACTDFAGPIPSTEPDTSAQPNMPNTGSPGGNGGTTGSAGGNEMPPPANEMPPPENPGGDDLVSFDTDVHPILVEMCGLCHSMEESGLPLHGAADVDESFAAVQGMSPNGEPVYDRILARAAGTDGFMPPGYAGCEELGTTGCLSHEQYDTIELWVQQGARNR